MSSSPGRNDPCPCGSDKKYKKCCMLKTEHEEHQVHNLAVVDFAWHNLRTLEGKVIDEHLIPYISKLPKDMMLVAQDDLFPEEISDSIDQELFFEQFFLPWFLFNWVPCEDFEIKNFNPDKTIAENYLKIHKDKLNRVEQEFIETMSKTYYSFYTVFAVDVDKSLTIKDILLGETHKIKERQGTHFLKRGDVIFSRILTLNDQSIFIGMAPLTIPAQYGSTLLDFRKWLREENDGKKLTAKALRSELDLELTNYFFYIINEAYNRPMPTLCNTDGELIQFSKSYFNLTLSMAETLQKLLPLTLSKDPTEFLSDADYDESGRINSIEFPWLKKGNKKHKSWDNTVMGNIRLEQDRLILETNSHQRTAKGKQLLLKYLGTNITFKQTLIESPEQKLKSLPASPDHNQLDQDLMQSPEMQEQLKQMISAHWDNWFTTSIPALGNKTPRAVAKTKAGREMLDALLLQYERYDLERSDNLLKADINYLRSELGLC